MGQVCKDLMTGSVLVVAGILAAAVVLVALSVLGFFLHILAVLASAIFFVGIILFFIWTVGYLFRKSREKRPQ